MFDNAIFDDPLVKKGGSEAIAEPETPPLPPPPPTYTAEQVVAARCEAWQAGLAAGLTQSREGIEYHLTLALSHLAMVADQWIAHETARMAVQERETLEIALALGQKFLPVLAEKANFEMIRHLVLTHLIEHPWQPVLNITVPIGTHERLKADLDAALQSRGLETRYQIIEDGALAPTSCHIGWGDGGKQQMIDRIWPVLAHMAEEVLAGRHDPASLSQMDAPMAPPVMPGLARFVLPDLPPPDHHVPPDINRLPAWMEPYDHARAMAETSTDETGTTAPPVGAFEQLDTLDHSPETVEHTAPAPDLLSAADMDQQPHTLEENQA